MQSTQLVRPLIIGDQVLIKESIEDSNERIESVLGEWSIISKILSHSRTFPNPYIYCLEGLDNISFSLNDFEITETNEYLSRDLLPDMQTESTLKRHLVVGDYVLVKDSLNHMFYELEPYLGKWIKVIKVPSPEDVNKDTAYCFGLEGGSQCEFSLKDFDIEETNKRLSQFFKNEELKPFPNLPNI